LYPNNGRDKEADERTVDALLRAHYRELVGSTPGIDPPTTVRSREKDRGGAVELLFEAACLAVVIVATVFVGSHREDAAVAAFTPTFDRVSQGRPLADVLQNGLSIANRMFVDMLEEGRE
jgi:hypothetical protein